MTKFFRLPLLVLSLTLFLFPQQDEDNCSSLKSYRKILMNPNPVTRNQQDFDVKYYDLDISIILNNESIEGTAGVLFESLMDGLSYIELDFASGMNVLAVTGADNEPLSYNHNSQDILSITLPQPLNSGELGHVIIAYSGFPESTGFGSFGFDSYAGEPMIWTLSEPYGAREWWPCKDTPTDKADSVDISIDVPENLVVASNGLLDSVEETAGRKIYHWKERYPIVTYLVSLAIYPYTTYSDYFVYGDNDTMSIDFFVFPNHYNLVHQNYSMTKTMIGAFSERFGLYPFIEEKYGHAEFIWGGGMEHQTISSMGGWSQYLISHELAHQWWGDMVTCANFHHIWLNEGFATYGQAMWSEIRDNDIQSLHNEMWDKRYLGSGTIFVEDTTSLGSIFSSNLVYRKGAWVLHMLRHVVGDTLFFQGLREYGDVYRFSSAVTEDFRDVMESVSGMDLHPFFQRWIYGEYYPAYQSEPSYRSTDNGTYFLTVILSQVQESPIFQMPVDIRTIMPEEEMTFRAEQTQRVETFSFVVPNQPVSVQIDPDNWILRTTNDGPLVNEGYVPGGDVNEDGILDVLDIINTINFILSPGTSTPFGLWITDMNADGTTDVLDVVVMVSQIIG